MKKIFFVLACTLSSLFASAQIFEVYNNDTLVNSYVNDDNNNYMVVVKEFTKIRTSDGYIINGHKFVDLGLSSGLLWAETNIGADKAADKGYYFAWGETESKSTYSWSTYKYGSSADNMSKYNDSDEKRFLDNSDDAAYVKWGSFCRIPSRGEFQELSDYTLLTWSWTSKTASDGSSIYGYEITSKKNGNSIFLPASGCSDYPNTSYGLYWARGVDSEAIGLADALSFSVSHNFSDLDHEDYYTHSRCVGMPIRPVAEP